MKEINASSETISKIIRVIDEIAFQTNILALNAAVEAARADQAGMGFAVVADEVRNPAQRSAKAAQDTAQLIEESIATSKAGGSKVDTVAEPIRKITGFAMRVKLLVDQVEGASREQVRGIEQLAASVLQTEEPIQNHAANAGRSPAAGAELAPQSKDLLTLVEKLQSLCGTGVSPGPALAPAAVKVPLKARSRTGYPFGQNEAAS